ncbi:hypothetical protein Tco_0776625 [Tanacetum coccineum]
MSTTDKESIAAGTDNRPPMLEESDFDSWKIRIQRTIRRGEQQTQVIRKKRDDEFTEAENIKELADIQAINILSQGLPRHIFKHAGLNQTETAQEIWENVELLMQGSGLTEQQQKEILFDQYERFRANGNESIHDYFVRFHKLINDMKITKIQILAHQRNTKFLNNLPSYWRMNISKECKEKKREKDSQWFKDKALLMEAKEKGAILDAEAEAFLADVEYEAPHTAVAFMANLTGTSTGEGTSNDTDFHSEVESNKSLKTESEKLKIDNKAHEDSYQEELTNFCFQGLTQTALGHSNPKYLITAQLSRPALYRGDIVINPLHTPHRVHDNEDTLVHAEVSRTKMSEKMKDLECPIISSPINYAKLNNLYDTFVPQKELTREQAYWLPANEVASNQSKPAQQFVHTRPAKSQVNSHLKTLKSCFPEFDEVIKFRTKPTCLTDGEWRFEHTKRCFVEQIIPFYEKLKTHVKGIEDNLFKEVSEYINFFDELDKEYDQCVIDKKCLEIENKNLLIQNECLLAESISKDICSVVLTPDNVVPISVEPCSNCDKEQTRNLELEAEFSKVKQLLVDKERRCSHIETEYLNLELKFQKYKECFENPQLKEQLQGKDNTIGKLKAQINN